MQSEAGPAPLGRFRDRHRGEPIIVCGCGVSLHDLVDPGRFITIGVNDIGRLFDPTYLVVVDPPERFVGDRFAYVRETRARLVFSQIDGLPIADRPVVRFRLGTKGGTDFASDDCLDYSVVSPYVAVCLAMLMGAGRIGLIGVDFTDHHFFGPTGAHGWTGNLAEVDAAFGILGAAIAARGGALVNLSTESRLTSLSRQSLDQFVATRDASPPAFAKVPERCPPRISVIVASLYEGEDLRHTLGSLRASLPDDSEIIIVDDASDDGSADFLRTPAPGVRLVRSSQRRGAAVARNDGAAQARGRILVFSDAHVAVPPGWVDALLASLDEPGVGAVMPAVHPLQSIEDYGAGDAAGQRADCGFGLRWADAALGVSWLGQKGSAPYAVPLLGAGFMAIRRSTFRALGGFDPALRLWGSEDAELSMRLWLYGLECRVVPAVAVAHRFRARHPYPVDWVHVVHNRLRLAALHFGPSRCRAVFDRWSSHPAFPAAFAELRAGNVTARRRALDAFRRHDDDWFFRRFARDLPPDLIEAGEVIST